MDVHMVMGELFSLVILQASININLFKRISNLPMGNIFGVLYCIF